MIKGDSKHIQKIAKELIESHMKVIDLGIHTKDGLLILSKRLAIISAQLCKDQFLLAPDILFWSNVIQTIKDYKYE